MMIKLWFGKPISIKFKVTSLPTGSSQRTLEPVTVSESFPKKLTKGLRRSAVPKAAINPVVTTTIPIPLPQNHEPILPKPAIRPSSKQPLQQVL